MRCLFWIALTPLVLFHPRFANAQHKKKIFISNDDHTDYMWTGNEAQYTESFIKMLDYYIERADQTQNLPHAYQSRFNCDGTYWLWEYERNKSAADFQKVIDKLKSGHLSVPYNALVSCYGAAPAEAILRGMYYAGYLQRKYAIEINQAVAMENQTLPLGLSSLWYGSGVKYSWKGVCDCATKINDLKKRKNQVYWYKGLDGGKVLMKWYSIPNNNKQLGGYAEARNPAVAIDQLTSLCGSPEYPYHIAGAFGYGWDDLQTMTDTFTIAAQSKASAEREVIVSNQSDFFKAFEDAYGNDIPDESLAYGNEWDVYSASMAQVSADVKRSVEKLRSAEAMATIVSMKEKDFADDLKKMRDKAWMAMGMYYEHDWTADGPVKKEERAAWQRKVQRSITSYVDTLYSRAVKRLGSQIKTNGSKRFYAFNPLSWTRTDVCDLPFEGHGDVKVIDVTTKAEVPSQPFLSKGIGYVRILAKDVPSIGYKVYEIVDSPPRSTKLQIRFQHNTFENNFYMIALTNQGVITSLIDKTNGNKQLVSNVNGRFMNDLGSGADNAGTTKLENNGNVSATVICYGKKPIAHTSRITLFNEIPRLEIHNEITENFGDVRSWAFSYDLSNADIRHEETGAVLTAKLSSHGGHYPKVNSRFDWLTLNHFVDIANKSYGFTLSNADCSFMKLGNSAQSNLDTATPQLSILAGGQVDGRGLGILDQDGDTLFTQRFAIRTHKERDISASMRFSLEHQNPIVVGDVTGAQQILPETKYSFLTLTPSAFLWTLKPSEDGIEKGLIARVWNLNNTAVPMTLSFTGEINAAYHTSHVETDLDPVSVIDGRLQETIGRNQMKTYRILIPLPEK